MKILIIGDVCGKGGLTFLNKKLPALKSALSADLVVVNGENASVTGITPQDAQDIFSSGADVITLGNHALDLQQIHTYLDDSSYITRPMNMPPQQPGQGAVHIDIAGQRVCVFNLIGRVHMGKFSYNDPFAEADRFLSQDKSDIYILDFHAETTSEKKAMGYHLDGRVSAVFGTHTHVPTADEQVLPKGTGFITDVGMCGSYNSVLGIEWQQSLDGFRGNIIGRYRESKEPCYLCGVVFEVDSQGKCTSVQRITER